MVARPEGLLHNIVLLVRVLVEHGGHVGHFVVMSLLPTNL